MWPLRLNRRLAAEVVSMAWPLIIGQLSESILSITDTFFVSRLGDIYIAAVGVSSYVSWLLFILVQLFSVGVLIIVAQSWGAKKLDTASRVVGEALSLGLPITALVAFSTLLWGYSYLLVLSVNESIASLGYAYLIIRVIALPASTASMIFGSTFRGVGDTRTTMYVTATSSLLNIVLDPLLIFGVYPFPRLGIVGAALATTISIYASLPIYLLFIAKGKIPFKIRLYIPSKLTIKSLYLGIPATVERLITITGHNVYVNAVARAGTEALAAHNIGLRIESFVYLPSFAMSIAASSLVGQKVGSGNIEEAAESAKEATKISILFMLLTGGILIAISPFVPMFFTSNPVVVEYAMYYLILAGISEPGMGIAHTLFGAFRGGGNTWLPIVINFISVWAFRAVVAQAMAPLYGAVGAWFSMITDMYARAVIAYIIFKKYFISKIAKKLV